jgi:hypothetical protein
VLALTLSGCANDADVCAGYAGECLSVEARPLPGDSIVLDQLELRDLVGSVIGDRPAFTPAVAGAAVKPPVLVAVRPPIDFRGDFVVEVSAVLRGTRLRHGNIGGPLSPGVHLQFSVDLEFHDAELPPDGDLAWPPGADLAQAQDLAAGEPCRTVPQFGCGANQKCTFSSLSPPTTVCRPNGTLLMGARCNPDDDQCVAGTFCFGDKSTGGDSQCRQLCDHDNMDSDCTQPSGPGSGNTPHCFLFATGTSSGLCTSPCNPALAAGSSQCPSGSACYYSPRTFFELTDCSTVVGGGTNGVSCTGNADCAAGFTCTPVGTTGASACRQVCRAHTDADCTLNAGLKCTQGFIQPNGSFGSCCPSGGC